jgi:hypothetical protein
MLAWAGRSARPTPTTVSCGRLAAPCPRGRLRRPSRAPDFPHRANELALSATTFDEQRTRQGGRRVLRRRDGVNHCGSMLARRLAQSLRVSGRPRLPRFKALPGVWSTARGAGLVHSSRKVGRQQGSAAAATGRRRATGPLRAAGSHCGLGRQPNRPQPRRSPTRTASPMVFSAGASGQFQRAS